MDFRATIFYSSLKEANKKNKLDRKVLKRETHTSGLQECRFRVLHILFFTGSDASVFMSQSLFVQTKKSDLGFWSQRFTNLHLFSWRRGLGSVLLHHSAYSVSGQHRLCGGAQVPDAAVLRLTLQPQGGAVPGEAVQPVGAAVSGLVVEARQASKGRPLIQRPEAGARVPAVRRQVSFSGGWLGGGRSGATTYLPSRERCRLPW